MKSEKGNYEQQFCRKGVERLSVIAGNMPSQLPFLSSVWSSFIVFYSIIFTGGCFGQRSYTPENDNEILAQSNNIGQQTMSCNASEDNSLQCQNGGTCFLVRTGYGDGDGFRRATCSCAGSWRGERCELKFIDHSLWATHHSNTVRASIAAGLSTCILLLCVGGLVLVVYLRYRKKQWLTTDRLFKATAEELYRRPFNGRSSVVESLSRISSLRRTAATEDKAPEHPTADGMEISIQVECVQSAEGQQNDNTSDASDTNTKPEIVDSDFISK